MEHFWFVRFSNPLHGFKSSDPDKKIYSGTMKRKASPLVVAGLVTLLLVVVFTVWYVVSRSSSPQIIRGRVTHILNECQYDGTCAITIDNSTQIITGCGLMAGGKTCKSYDQSKLHIGQQIEATVMKGRSGSYNLECDSCLIRVLQ